jgi:hypothetical protein
MTNIEELRHVIRSLHGAEATHIDSVRVKEMREGKIVWDRVVEVFDLAEHPSASRAYAWSLDTGDPRSPRRHVAVLHLHPIKSARDAVRATFVQDFVRPAVARER